MALQPYKPPPVPGEGGQELVVTATGQRVSAEEYERRVKEADALGEKLKAITESVPTITRNVQGSAAGAGSSTFHIYRLARERNAAREAALAAEEAAAAAQAGVEARRAAAAEADAARTAKKRAARAKKKERAKRRREGGGGGDGGGGGGAESDGGDAAPAGAPPPAVPAADLD